MNRQAKSAIKSLVLTLRHKLEEDIAIGLKRYGFAGERWLPLERLPHIERDDAASADHFRLRASLEQHLRRIGAEPAGATAAQREEAVDWFVREVAFTHLNRLVALKCLEARGLIPEIITVRDAYGGRARAHYEHRFDHPDEAAGADDALPAAIRDVCRMVYPEFRLLFDVGDPAVGRKPPADDIVWPSFPVLRECIALINGLDAVARDVGARHSLQGTSLTAAGASNAGSAATREPPENPTGTLRGASPLPDSLWLEDEIIGWIYQFYNAEQKEAIRKRGAPRRPAEVAVINQFFTPRWIVKFLVDNTLGRLWLEMHPDSVRVRAKCDYLVPEPLGRETRRQGEGDRRFKLDPDSPINNPKAPARRKAKRPQEIRLIDPACGAMHFGHYAFEVFQEIYADAREQGWVTGADALPDEEVPAAILRHNLYGVDIDLRAVQLAALSLFIKAKSANPQAHITGMNLVVADAVLPADGARAQFLERYKDDEVVQDAVRQVLDEMANVAEVGSLLRVEERLRAILEKAGHAAARDAPRALEGRRQPPLPDLPGKGGQLALADLPDVQPADWGAHYTAARLLDDLREFTAAALQTHDLNAQLFAEEAEKSVHLLDVFLNDYDVAVMNPPFGNFYNTTERGWQYIKSLYPQSDMNVLCAFIERGLHDLCKKGYVGALADKGFMVKSRYEKFRRSVILDQATIVTLADVGWEVLDDAQVETAAVVLAPISNARRCPGVFLRTDTSNAQATLNETLASLIQSHASSVAYVLDQDSFRRLPNAVLSYWLPASIRRYFDGPPMEPTYAFARAGIHPGDAERYFRYFWEVAMAALGTRWVSLAKGGGYQPFYRDCDQIILYADDGCAVKANPRAIVANEDFYFRTGITYGARTEYISFQILPQGGIFTTEGQAFFPVSLTDRWWILAVLNSQLTRYAANAICGLHKHAGYLRQLPLCRPSAGRETTLASAANAGHDIKAAWDTGNETCTHFDAPWLTQARRGALLRLENEGRTTNDLSGLLISQVANLPASQSTNLSALLDHLLAVERAADARLQQLQAEIDDAVYELYEIMPEDRALIERELGNRPPEVVWPQMKGKPDAEKRREHVRRLVSWCVLNALKEKRDGILPVTPVAGEASALDAVRRGLEGEFGEAAAFKIESDIGQVLGQPLADWLDGPLVRWHTQLYKRRPIIWHLASPKNGFGCFVHIHRLDADTLRKVQALYLWPRRRAVEAERDEALRAKMAGAAGAARRVDGAEALLDDLAEFEKRLLSVVQAQVKCEIPDWAEGPFRGGVYDPMLDDGVKVNITPLQEAGVLRYR